MSEKCHVGSYSLSNIRIKVRIFLASFIIASPKKNPAPLPWYLVQVIFKSFISPCKLKVDRLE
jgi:hypothetical protein